MSAFPSAPHALPLFVQCLKKVPDPRSKHGTYHPFRTILALVFLGLLGNVTTLAEIERWTKLYFPQLKKFLNFRTKQKKWQITPPDKLFRLQYQVGCTTTLFR